MFNVIFISVASVSLVIIILAITLNTVLSLIIV